MPRLSTHARLSRAAAEATETAVKSHELAMASVQVIAARLALTGPAAATEAALLVPEKTEAFAASGAALANRMGELAVRTSHNAAREAAKAAEATADMVSALTPADLALAQSRYLTGWFARAAIEAAHFAGFAARAHAEALAPIHKAATANARRLRK